MAAMVKTCFFVAFGHPMKHGNVYKFPRAHQITKKISKDSMESDNNYSHPITIL